MKQLKFMLAAATAIGLATAAQAGYLSGSTDFETGTLADLFTYEGNPEDNESVITNGAAEGVAVGNNNFTGEKTKKLKVNTAETPIVRSVNGTDNGESLANGNVYVDTLVQFTVTPNDDDPDPVEGSDKLMIYLKEDLSDTENPKTNLVAKAGYLTSDGSLKSDTYVLNTGVGIIPNKWYRLTVSAYANVAGPNAGNAVYPAFSVSIDGTACVAHKVTYDSSADSALLLFLGSSFATELNEKKLILSLLQDATVKAVGFAGEGEVDDLVISTFNPEKTVVDFTLVVDGDLDAVTGNVTYETDLSSGTIGVDPVSVYCYEGETVKVDYTLTSEEYTATWSAIGADVPISGTFEPADNAAYTLTFASSAPSTVDFTLVKGTGVSAVEWTINDNAPAESNKVKKGDVIKITNVEYDDLYVKGTVGKGYSMTITDAEIAAGVAISVTVDATALTGSGDGAVPEGTKAEDIGITNTEFADADKTELDKLVKWATTASKGSLGLVNSMTFDTNGNPDGTGKTAAEAYLLDCATTEVENKKGEFKLTITFDKNGDPVVTGPDGSAETYKNGNIVLKGRESLSEGDWADKAAGHKFFKAFLTK